MTPSFTARRMIQLTEAEIKQMKDRLARAEADPILSNEEYEDLKILRAKIVAFEKLLADMKAAADGDK